MALFAQEIIEVPENCSFKLNKKIIEVTGPRGTVCRDLTHIMMTLDSTETEIRLRLWNGKRPDCAKLKTAASIIKSMFEGVTKGFQYKMKAAYKHFPISVEIEEEGKKLLIKNFMGEKNTREFDAIGDSTIEMGDEKDTFVINGIDKYHVSQLAGHIQNTFRPTRFDMRVFLDGIYITQKKNIEADF